MSNLSPARRLSEFDNRYQRGRPRLVQALWFLTAKLAFERFWFPAACRPAILRLFGAQVGSKVLIRHYVRVMWPWKLSVGDNCWIGEGTWFINLEPISIGSNVCISQGALVCTGSHDHTRTDFAYKNRPIQIMDGAWIAARALILPGVKVGRCSVVAAGEVVRAEVPDLSMLVAGQLRPVPDPL